MEFTFNRFLTMNKFGIVTSGRFNGVGWRQILWSSLCVWLTLNLCGAVQTKVSSILLNDFERPQCSSRRYNTLIENIRDSQELTINEPLHVELNVRQRKRFILRLNASTPLIIKISNILARKLYYNGTTSFLSIYNTNSGQPLSFVVPCALPGQYDLFVQSKFKAMTIFEADIWHPEEHWNLWSNSTQISAYATAIHTQNQMRRRQMIIKWDKSKLDAHAVHYCIVISTKRANNDFCRALKHYVSENARYNRETCSSTDNVSAILSRITEKVKKIDPFMTNVLCTGSHTQQVVRGLAINLLYYIDVFGIHRHRQNASFHLASTMVHFQRSPPSNIKPNLLTTVRLSGFQGMQMFTFEIPSVILDINNNRLKHLKVTERLRSLRYIILPCGGSEVDAKIIRQRIVISYQRNIYKPTYMEVPSVMQGDRYLIHFKPSDEDEILKANKIMLAATTDGVFSSLAELPKNTTVFEVRTRCTSTEIAWYSAHELRQVSYCIIVLNVTTRNRSAAFDSTNYCLDFSKRVTQHPQFYSITCPKLRDIGSLQSPLMQTAIIYNLKPGNSYLIYVTINLMLPESKPLPYQSLRVKTYTDCLED